MSVASIAPLLMTLLMVMKRIHRLTEQRLRDARTGAG
jgi:hypothetical protein